MAWNIEFLTHINIAGMYATITEPNSNPELFLNNITGVFEQQSPADDVKYKTFLTDVDDNGNYIGAVADINAGLLPKAIRILVIDPAVLDTTGPVGDLVTTIIPGNVELGSSPCDGVYYANRSDIELVFGSSNVARWADVNNNLSDNEISARICWALQNAKAYFDDMLNGGPYTVPFAAPYPQQIITENARYAGCMLYDSRGVVDMVDGKAVDGLAQQRKKTEAFIVRVLANQTQLVGQTGTINVPGFYDDETATSNP